VIERIERQQAVRDAVDGLDERCRRLLTLLFYGNTPPSYADVAATLGMPEGSIGPTRARCLQRVRQALQKLEHS
jgi:DNA-directed RNA polymerase specialized sigma24 family protein